MDVLNNTQYNSTAQYRRWGIANTVLVGINLLLLFPFIFLILRTRSLRDPSRRWLKWLKLAFWLFFICLALAFTSLVIAVCAAYNVRISLATARATFHLSYLSQLFDTLSAAAAMVFLFELGPGIRHATKGAFRRHDKFTRWWALFLFVVVAALAVAYYGLMVDLNENYSNRLGQVDWFSFGGTGEKRARAVRDLVAAATIILFAAALMIMGVAIWTWMRRRLGILRSVSTKYLIAAFLNLVAQTWAFAYVVHWLLMGRAQERWVMILQAILGWWMRGFALIVGYLIAKRGAERGGVWSVPVTTKGTTVPAGARGVSGDYRASQSTY